MRSPDGLVYSEGTPYTVTTADFVQPTVGGTVAVSMAQAAWLVVNQTIFIGGPTAGSTVGGSYIVSAVTGQTGAWLLNTGD